MNPEVIGEGISKGLEVWSLQTLLDIGILFIFFALGLIAFKVYLDKYREKLTLRLSVEIWEILISIFIDILMILAFLIGFFTTNPDIMADIKIGLPWIPIAFLLMGVSFVLRAFYGGNNLNSKSWYVVFFTLILSAIFSWFGFTFVMEGATVEYFKSTYPHFWSYLHNMRSDLNRDLSLNTFYLLSPFYILTFIWMIFSGLRGVLKSLKEENSLKEDGN